MHTPTIPQSLSIGEPPSRPPRRRRSPIVVMTAFSARRPWVTIGAWLVLVVTCYLLGSAAGTVKATEAQTNPGEAITASQLVDAAGLGGPDHAQVLLTAADGGPLDGTAAAAAVANLDISLPRVAGVRSVADPVPSADGRAMLVPATLNDDFAGDAFRAAVAEAATAPGVSGIRLQATGGNLIDDDVDTTLGDSFSTALTISLPVTLLIMLVAFGALLAAGIPVLLGVTSVLSAVGLYAVASHAFPDGGQTAEVILLVGMAVGVDYSLFYLRREREERRAGRSDQAALSIAAATAGRAVVTSGFAVCIALAGMFLTNDATFTAMAIGTIAVVLLAVLGSLTVLPATLSLLGSRVDKPRIPLLGRLAGRAGSGATVRAMLRPAMRHPVATVAITVAGLAAIILPAFGLQLRANSVADLPDSMPSVVAYRDLVAAFPERSVDQFVVVSAPAEQTTATKLAVTQLVSMISADQHFAGEPQVHSNGPTTVVDVAVPGDPQSDRAKEALRLLRERFSPGDGGCGTRRNRGGRRGNRCRGRRRRWDRRAHTAGLRLRAGADPGVDDAGVLVPGHGVGDGAGQPALGRRRVRRAGAGVPAHLGRRCAGLLLHRRDHLLDPHVPVRHPVRSFDGLPRAGGVADQGSR